MSSDGSAQCIKEYDRRIRAFFARRCASPDDADDLVQEAFASIIRSYPAFAGRSSLSTWVYAICRNVFSNYLYHRDRERKLAGRLRADCRVDAPEDLVETRMLIDQLPAASRTLYSLYYVQGRGVRQIASILDMPEGTIKYLLYRLRQRIRLSLR
jgi:RNA polymerase sigma-70 factor (ECF subfamily)